MGMHDTELSRLIRRELDERGIGSLKEAARYLGVSSELARLVLNLGRVPRDRTLVKIAQVLGLEPAVLILAGHRQKLPRELRKDMLTIAAPAGGNWKQKRKWPLSQEQCEYLGRMMQAHEIQLIRKCRQLTPQERVQLAGYVDFQFATSRVSPPEQTGEPAACAAEEGAA